MSEEALFVLGNGRVIDVSRVNERIRRYIQPWDGRLYKYSSVGCYPLVYLTPDLKVMCSECASDEMYSEDGPNDADANWEDPELFCDVCGERIESAYAEDDAIPRE